MKARIMIASIVLLLAVSFAAAHAQDAPTGRGCSTREHRRLHSRHLESLAPDSSDFGAEGRRGAAVVCSELRRDRLGDRHDAAQRHPIRAKPLLPGAIPSCRERRRTLRFTSDNGSQAYLNGRYVGRWGGDCGVALQEQRLPHLRLT